MEKVEWWVLLGHEVRPDGRVAARAVYKLSKEGNQGLLKRLLVSLSPEDPLFNLLVCTLLDATARFPLLSKDRILLAQIAFPVFEAEGTASRLCVLLGQDPRS